MNVKTERINEQIRKVFSVVLREKLNDPRLSSFITITKVNTSQDLSYCKVFVGIMDKNAQEQKNLIFQLQKASGLFKNALAHDLKLRIIPNLAFVLDENADYSMRINEILKTLNIPKGDEDESNSTNND